MTMTLPLSLVLLALVPVVASAQRNEVLVGTSAVEPEVLQASTDRPVIFRNMSERPIELSFVGYAGLHHVSPHSHEIRVVFHRAGKHPYVVRVSGPGERHLHGVVEVDQAAINEPAPRAPVCSGITVVDVCIQP